MKAKITRTITILLILLIGILMTSYILIQTGKTAEIHDVSKVDVLIILGAGLWGDQVSPQLALRLETAKELAEDNPDLLVLVSGGQGPDEWVSEAQAMKDYLIGCGVNADRILMEDKSTSTFENLLFSLKLLEDKSLDHKQLAFVTTDFHVFRAKMLFERFGVDVSAQAAPNIDSIVVKNNLREVFALIKDFVISHN